tara:strand:- start:67817 stop:68338 length:522 start_codon:yes stop_codon:yes gene_type:complete
MINEEKSCKIGKRTYKALVALYKNSRDMQRDGVNRFNGLSDLAYAKEFCTIKMATSRQAGHSTAIAKFVTKHNKKWLILTPNMEMAIRARHNCVNQSCKKIIKMTPTEVLFENEQSITFASVRQIERLDTYFDGVILDCAALVSQKQIEEIYTQVLKLMRGKLDPEKYFIFVE